MGTNYYWKTPDTPPLKHTLPTGVELEGIISWTWEDSPEVHIGKSSAAGMFCFGCQITLCKGGTNSIHAGRSEWHDVCPRCGAVKSDDGMSGANKELWGKARETRPGDGVRGCCSFTWAQDPERVRRACEVATEKVIRDEYGRDFTGPEFLQLLAANCPIQFRHSIGKSFS